MTNKEVVTTYMALTSGVFKEVQGTKLNYALVRNLDRLEDEVKAIEAGRKPSEEYLKYDAEKRSIQIKYAIKNEDGEPQIFNYKYHFTTENSNKAKAEIEKLNSKYKTTIEAFAKAEKEFQEFLEEENKDFKPYIIKQEWLPDNLTGEQMSAIYNLLEP